MKKTGSLFFILFCMALNVSAQHRLPLDNELKSHLGRIDIYDRLDSVLENISAASMEENRIGFGYYQKNDWDNALIHFRDAFVLDEGNSFAHFNLACTLAILYKGRYTWNVTAEIVEHLEIAARLDPYWGIKIFLDSDLDPLRSIRAVEQVYIAGEDCAPAETYTYYNWNGTVYCEGFWDDTSYMGPADPEVEEDYPDYPIYVDSYTGYYCFIGDARFEYYPEVKAMRYCDSGENAVYCYNVYR